MFVLPMPQSVQLGMSAKRRALPAAVRLQAAAPTAAICWDASVGHGATATTGMPPNATENIEIDAMAVFSHIHAAAVSVGDDTRASAFVPNFSW